MAEEHREEHSSEETARLQIPTGKVKKIMKLDKDVKKVNPEALFLISTSTELFLKLLAEKCAEVAVQKKRKTVNLEILVAGVKRHRPTTGFLLDSLPQPSEPAHKPTKGSRNRSKDKPVSAGTRKIDAFFLKCT
ncbi:unnamed protein product [Cuscuta campestris]|uniref:Transcription factor CBF/NF-Y/archaeal histone domain-containing protein n=2 Tax=Cuscuta sect. Cleistogrammica TaxID=1824901 RepID=A0A484LWQ3_9ASTE|nr:hypothetical protein DM860_008199 [Cuscuta australis]VFQ80208.1 unnamed protein product [Cuscuta campestris]